MHSLMVAGERLHACGYKGDGRLGLGGPDGRGANIYGVGPEPVAGAFKPQPVDADDLIFGGRRFRQIACGDHHSVALVEAPLEVFAWGKGEDGRCGHGCEASQLVPRRVLFCSAATAAISIVEIGAGSDHTLARASDGRVFAFGLGGQGQLGLGDLENQALPRQVGLDAGAG